MSNSLEDSERDDLPAGEVEESKLRTRINAAILGLVFLLTFVAPAPWNVYAPVLFLIPVLYTLVSRVRRSAGALKRTELPDFPAQDPQGFPTEPYADNPRDPKDPRRYKPIG